MSSTKPPFVRRLTDDDAQKVASGVLRAELDDGTFLEKPALWNDQLNGVRVMSLMGEVGIYKYSWPACGCGIRRLIRAVPL